MRFPQADAAQKDQIGLVLDKLEAEVVLHLEAVNPSGPVPAELLQGFDDGEARQANAAFGGAIAPHVGLAFHESGRGSRRGTTLCVPPVLANVGILLRDKAELQIGEMVIDGRQSGSGGDLRVRCAQPWWQSPPLMSCAAGCGWRDKC